MKTIRNAAFALFTLLLANVSVSAQSVVQSGTVTPGHAASWATNGVIQDAGPATFSNITSIGTTAVGPSICASNAKSGAINRLCLGTTSTGGGTISLDNISGGTGGFTFKLNGAVQGFPTVNLPVTAGDFSCFANTTGTLADCGTSPIILTTALQDVVRIVATPNTSNWSVVDVNNTVRATSTAVSATTNGSTAIGNPILHLTSVAGIVVGNGVFVQTAPLNAIPSGATVQSINTGCTAPCITLTANAINTIGSGSNLVFISNPTFFSDAVTYAGQHGYSLKCQGQAARSTDNSIGPTALWITDGPVTFPANLFPTVDLSQCQVYIVGSDGFIIDTSELNNFKGPSIIGYQNDGTAGGAALRFVGTTANPVDGNHGSNICSFDFGAVVVQSGATTAKPIRFDLANGGIWNCNFKFAEPFNGHNDGTGSGGIAVQVDSPTASTFFKNNQLNFGLVHGCDITCIQIGTSASNQANIFNNQWTLGSIEPSNAAAHAIDTYGTNDTFLGSVASIGVGYTYAWLTHSGAINNRMLVNYSGASSAYSDGATGTYFQGNGNLAQVLNINVSAPGTPASGQSITWTDNTTGNFNSKDSSGNVAVTVRPKTVIAHQFLTALDSFGTLFAAQPALGDLPNIAANTMLGNWTALSAAVTANAMPSCPDTTGNHLNYVNGTGVTCGTGIGSAITALTGDVTATGPGSVAATLATVNSNVGTFGSATQSPQITVSGKGLTTAVSNVTITPAVGSLTGLGTGVATALGVNVGTSGSFVANGGALGSPSSAGTLPAYTLGGTVSGGGNQINNVVIGTSTPLAGTFTALTATSSFTATGLVQNASLVNMNASTIKGRQSSGSGVPQDLTLGSGLITTSGILNESIQQTNLSGSSPYTVLTTDRGTLLFDNGENLIANLSSASTYGTGWFATFYAVSGKTVTVNWSSNNLLLPNGSTVSSTVIPAGNLLAAYTDGFGWFPLYYTPGVILQTNLNVTGSGVILSGLASDAAATDVTLCSKSSDGTVLKGSGTLGICLGTSSARYKHSISPMEEGLTQLAKLAPINFFYNKGAGDDGARVQYGFLAEDFAHVLPKLTHYDNDNKPNSIDLLGLVPIVVKAIQELKADNDNIRSEMQTLKRNVK